MSDRTQTTTEESLKNALDAFDVVGGTLTTADGTTVQAGTHAESGDAPTTPTDTPTDTPTEEGSGEGESTDGPTEADIRATWASMEWHEFEQFAAEHGVSEGDWDARIDALIEAGVHESAVATATGEASDEPADDPTPTDPPRASDMGKRERGEVVEAVENGTLDGATAKDWFLQAGRDYHALRPCPAKHAHEDTDGKVGVNPTSDGFAPLCASCLRDVDEDTLERMIEEGDMGPGQAHRILTGA